MFGFPFSRNEQNITVQRMNMSVCHNNRLNDLWNCEWKEHEKGKFLPSNRIAKGGNVVNN